MATNREILLSRLGLTEKDSKTLLEKTVTHALPSGTIVLEKGNPGDSLYIVLEGRVKVVGIDSNGDEQVLSYYAPGDYFGWMGFGEGMLTT
jgi:CRP/FNR family cyclic AMP-dependent transcriptional regulator